MGRWGKRKSVGEDKGPRRQVGTATGSQAGGARWGEPGAHGGDKRRQDDGEGGRTWKGSGKEERRHTGGGGRGGQGARDN